MSHSTKQFLTFIATTAGWAVICRIILEAKAVSPAAVAIVWLVGFVWMTGYIIAGRNSADHLVKFGILYFGAMAVITYAGVLLIS